MKLLPALLLFCFVEIYSMNFLSNSPIKDEVLQILTNDDVNLFMKLQFERKITPNSVCFTHAIQNGSMRCAAYLARNLKYIDLSLLKKDLSDSSIELLMRVLSVLNKDKYCVINLLTYFAANGHIKCCEELLNGWAPLNGDRHCLIPLHYAIRGKQLACVKLLIEKGADQNIQDRYGDTSLHVAIKTKDIEIIEYLLSNKVYDNIQNFEHKLARDYIDDLLLSAENKIKISSLLQR